MSDVSADLGDDCVPTASTVLFHKKTDAKKSDSPNCNPLSLLLYSTPDTAENSLLHKEDNCGASEFYVTEKDVSTDNESEEVILSVYWRKGLLGAAYYAMETSQITVMNDIVDVNPEFNMLHSLFYQVHPTKVITSSKLSPKFISAIKVLLCGDTEDICPGKDLSDQSKLILLPGKNFHYESCRRRVLNIKFPNAPEEFGEEEHVRYINSLLEMTAESMIFSLGCLLQCLDKSYLHLNLDVRQKTAPVLAINTISLQDIVMIDADSYEALQVFNQLSHPSNFKAGTPGSSKEGLSIFGIFNRCKTTMGSHLMRTMFLHPTQKIDVLNNRLNAVEFCADPRNCDFVSTAQDCLKYISNVSRTTARLASVRASVNDWKCLHKTILYSTTLGELCSLHKEKTDLFRKFADCITDDLYEAGHMIGSIIDFPESEKQNRFVVQLGIDEELDRKKHKYGCLPALMTTMAQEELDDLPDYVKECSVIYIPEIGYLLAIPVWKEEINDDEIKIPGLEFMFQVDGVIHYKSTRCRELDIVLGDVVVQITEHETSIMIKLINYIQPYLELVCKVVQLAAELDCMISLAVVAKENSYVRPILTEERIIKIKDGRHPLQEKCVNDFVPNDTLSSKCNGLMKVLTGPNASGKSVYLKQVALIAYLTHIGSFVPATSATIGCLSHIFTRIQTVESIATRLSAFMIDLKQMSKALYCSTPSSLIIIDEFGKGTVESDGLGLLVGSLEQFLSRGGNCPHVFVSTHFHRAVQLLPETQYLNFQVLEYTIDRDDNIIYLYKLKEGSTESSFTLRVALSLGVKETTVKRAQKVLNTLKATGSPKAGLIARNNFIKKMEHSTPPRNKRIHKEKAGRRHSEVQAGMLLQHEPPPHELSPESAHDNSVTTRN
ncbi:mutS protein homolog 5-like [Schistocerca nitens]|uniref:mutS protein homolog 5-like n=1 Tax=Schistocerca nitens TaxID=7011 RepID=UPI0021190ABC|nr:mutS protein homolog 5-like [Schistocerca nitens]